MKSHESLRSTQAVVGSSEGGGVLRTCFPSWKGQGQGYSREGSAPGLVAGSCLVRLRVATATGCSHASK